MSAPDGWSGTGQRNWLLPLLVVVGTGLYSWKARRAEAAARRGRFDAHLSHTYRGGVCAGSSGDDDGARPPVSPTVATTGQGVEVPPRSGSHSSSPLKPSTAAFNPAASGRVESVVLSPMDTRDWSIRLFPDSLSTAPATPPVHGGNSVSGEHDRKGSVDHSDARTDGRVHVGALSVQVRAGFAQQPGSYSFPVQTCSFVHQDGSRLCILAEELTATREPLTTTQYVSQSIDRLRRMTQEAKTYFKVKLHTSASVIVTTIMERYVSLHIGPSPSIVICFFLTHASVAYTVQLQCQPEEYERRLTDVLMAVQTARLDTSFTSGQRGHNCYTLSTSSALPRSPVTGLPSAAAVLSQRTYAVHLPTELIAHRNPLNTTTLSLTHAHSTTWSGEVRVMTADDAEAFAHSCTPVVAPLPTCTQGQGQGCGAADEEPLSAPSTEYVAFPEFLPLIDGELYIYLNPRSVAEPQFLHDLYTLLSSPVRTWAEQTGETTIKGTRTASMGADLGTKQMPCFYISPQLRLPLPPLHQFTTQVCEHVGDRGVTLLVREPSGDLFEMELRVVALRETQLPHLTAAIDRLFVAPVHPQPTTNTAGQRIICAEGLAAAGGDVTLRLDCVQVAGDKWLIIRWLFDDSSIFTRELEQYKERLYDTVFV